MLTLRAYSNRKHNMRRKRKREQQVLGVYMLLCGNEESEFSQGFSPGSDNGGRFGAVSGFGNGFRFGAASGFGNSFKFTGVGIREDVGIGWAPVSDEGFARTCFMRSAHNSISGIVMDRPGSLTIVG